MKTNTEVQQLDNNLTNLEREVMLYIAKYNDGYLKPFPKYLLKNKKETEFDVIRSLYYKNFIYKKFGIDVLKLTDNVLALIEIEGNSAFKEIVK